jgi:adenylate cyclase
MNTILERQFLNVLPWWFSLLVAIILAWLITVLIRSLNPQGIIILGSISLFMMGAGSYIYLISNHTFFNPLTPALAVLFVSFTSLLCKLALINKEKAILRQIFFSSLSKNSLASLLKEPVNVRFKGEQKQLTTLLTEMEGFSAIINLLGPEDLVSFLNTYFREICNVLLEEKGTVNKFYKDSVIAFFGAPIAFPDHVRRACLAAVRIKKMEKLLNQELLRKKVLVTPFLTKMVINSGDMIVGNMGTSEKVDYTVSGPGFEFASHLKRLNKLYGTQILIGESTYLAGGNEYYVRMLDKIRVDGNKNPIRLYELIDEKDKVDARIKEGVEFFHEGMHQFEKKDWDRAELIFKKVLTILPHDYPSILLYRRCQKYKKESPKQRSKLAGAF